MYIDSGFKESMNICFT